jgi:hypothetical protein
LQFWKQEFIRGKMDPDKVMLKSHSSSKWKLVSLKLQDLFLF